MSLFKPDTTAALEVPARRGRPPGSGGPRLAEWTTLGVGGPARELVEVADIGALQEVLGRAAAKADPLLVLGGGSNVLIADEGFPGIVAHIGLKGRVARSEGGDVIVSVAAGEDWASFVERCVDEGLSGVECMSGIPGSVGGAPVQNIGAYGEEVRETITRVMVWDRRQSRARRLTAAQCRFSYRGSIFKRNERYIVTEVTFRLHRSTLSQPLRYAEVAERLGRRLGARAPLAETADAVMGLRRSKGMVIDHTDPDTRSAGSFFTNPVLGDAQLGRVAALLPGVPQFAAAGGTKVPAAWLVEGAGFARGFSRGTAAISTKHALALTSRPGGSAADVVALAVQVRGAVQRRFGVLLEPEPVLVGARL
ncbi:MAG: UDP-N-acetylmuramate dehydrogenase [Acidimicrobiales bacterium]